MQQFRTLYCDYHHLPEEQFEETLLQRSLYPHARWLAPLLTLFHPLYFSTDRVTIQQIGRARQSRQWEEEVRDFRSLAENRLFPRKVLRLRISLTRLKRELSAAGIPLFATSSRDPLKPL